MIFWADDSVANDFLRSTGAFSSMTVSNGP